MKESNTYFRIGNAKGWCKESHISYATIKEVKTRKEHICNECGRIIQKGEIALLYRYGNIGNLISDYFCSDCYEKMTGVDSIKELLEEEVVNNTEAVRDAGTAQIYRTPSET